MANIKLPYGPKERAPHPSSGVASRVKQAAAEECDINQMMKRYQKTGQLPAGIGVGRYGDFYGVDDYLQAQIVVKTAELQFNWLPSSVREKFSNDPSKLLQFVADEKNLEEARKLGLLKEEIKDPEVKALAPVENPK